MTLLLDPKTGEIVSDPKKIREVSLRYCKEILTNKEPAVGYEEVYENKIRLHNIRMKEKVDDDIEELQYFQFSEALEKQLQKNMAKNINSS